MPRADALYLSTAMLREGFGRVVYRVMGYARSRNRARPRSDGRS